MNWETAKPVYLRDWAGIVSPVITVLAAIGATLAFARADGGDIGRLTQSVESNVQRIDRLEVEGRKDHAKIEGINQKLDLIIKYMEQRKP